MPPISDALRSTELALPILPTAILRVTIFPKASRTVCMMEGYAVSRRRNTPETAIVDLNFSVGFELCCDRRRRP
jgi:hypothetical protein